jgi:hypothetical protein
MALIPDNQPLLLIELINFNLTVKNSIFITYVQVKNIPEMCMHDKYPV